MNRGYRKGQCYATIVEVDFRVGVFGMQMTGVHPIVAATDVVDTARCSAPRTTGAESLLKAEWSSSFSSRRMNGSRTRVVVPLNSCRRIYARQRDCVHDRLNRLCKCASTWRSMIGFVFAPDGLQFADRAGLRVANCSLVNLWCTRQVVAMRVHSWSSERSQAVSARVVVRPRT